MSRLGGVVASSMPAHAPCCCRVERRLENSKTVAAFQFPGLPLDWCVLTRETGIRPGFRVQCSTAAGQLGGPAALLVCRRSLPPAVMCACFAQDGAAACAGAAAAATKA